MNSVKSSCEHIIIDYLGKMRVHYIKLLGTYTHTYIFTKTPRPFNPAMNVYVITLSERLREGDCEVVKKRLIDERARHSQVCSIENRGYIYSTCKFI